ncbi:MAG: STAS domain-containing protein [Candidatus Omnitrophica bacterium]|nr:STAS domain-containing protein [Candidatus Omnitrophota bacterium]
MQIKVEEKNGIKVCSAEGDIDINSSPQVKKAFDKLVQARSEKVVINLQKVAYIDSSGLATLVEILKNFKNAGGKLKLCSLSNKVKSLFEITKLEKLFDIKDSEDEALQTF